MTQSTTTKKKVLVGTVIGDKMAKTIVVEVSRRMRHAQYGKVMTKYKKYYVHDEQRAAGLGDVVRIIEAAPRSRLKRWDLVEVVEKSKSVQKVDV